MPRFAARRIARYGEVRSTGPDGLAASKPDVRLPLISLLALDLPDYLAAAHNHDTVVATRLIKDAGLICPRCGSCNCAKPHAWRYRMRVTDLSQGGVFDRLPILRIRFCDGRTRSLAPADLWRGRCTITSVIESVVHVLRDGMEAACDWISHASMDDDLVSDRTLRRWRGHVRSRLIGSALTWLGPETGLQWSDTAGEADQLEALLGRITGSLLCAFRVTFGRGLIDKPNPPAPLRTANSAARTVAGRHAETSSHDLSAALRPRGSWSVRRLRGPPPEGRSEGNNE